MKRVSKVLALSLAVVMILSTASMTTFAAESDTSDDILLSNGSLDIQESEATDGKDVTKTVDSALEKDASLYALSTDYNNRVFSQTINDVVNKETVTYTKASELARLVNLGYSWHNNRGPISITKATLNSESASNENVYVVGLSGTDMLAINTTTNVVTDLFVGFEQDNLYSKNIKKVIMANVPKGSNLIISGHSLGGMVAQQIAADQEIKDNYNVVNTVTFGSPLIAGIKREGKTQRLGDVSDVVPYLSVNTFTNTVDQVTTLNREDGKYYGAFIHAHCQSYQRDKVWGKYDVTGTKNGGATLTVDYSTTHFYSSPIL